MTESYNAEYDAGIEIHQIKVLDSIVKHNYRASKRMIRPMLSFKSFWSAAIALAGTEIMHMTRKGQLRFAGKPPPAQQFYSLAG